MEMLFLGAVSTAIQCERSLSPLTRPPRAIRPRHGSFPVTEERNGMHMRPLVRFSRVTPDLEHEQRGSKVQGDQAAVLKVVLTS